ncbi:DUF4105 domain-containing protein [Shimia sp. SDUM112013]|uniref:Lnb N-terminal periplasmic domain-containing protein n=1 Tax=Shimia sp. SDUM112013 TaxID=3136160 RepID=UPI0032ED93B2
MKRFASFVCTLVASLALLAFSLWAALALWFRVPFDDPLRLLCAAVFFCLGAVVSIRPFKRLPRLLTTAFGLVSATVLIWWLSLVPPSTGDWAADVARQTTGRLEGDTLILTDQRDFNWRSDTDFDARWIEKTYDLNSLISTDLFLSYWGNPAIAHLIVSFGFENGEYLAWSVEVRREKDSGFSPVADAFKEHTLSILAATETDVVGVRTNIRKEDVQLYRLRFDKETARALLLKYVEDANALSQSPRWYNSITTNCTTVVFHMMRAIGKGQPFDWRIIANGYLPEYGYERGSVFNAIPLADLRERSKISEKGQQAGLNALFSEKIREDVPVQSSANGRAPEQ